MQEDEKKWNWKVSRIAGTKEEEEEKEEEIGKNFPLSAIKKEKGNG